MKEREGLIAEIKKLKAVLRTPRLYTLYMKKIDYMQSLKQKYENEKFHHTSAGKEHKDQVLKDWSGNNVNIHKIYENLKEIE